MSQIKSSQPFTRLLNTTGAGRLLPIREDGPAVTEFLNPGRAETNVLNAAPGPEIPPRPSYVRNAVAVVTNATQSLTGSGVRAGPDLDGVTDIHSAVRHTLNVFTDGACENSDCLVALACCGVTADRTQRVASFAAELGQMTDAQLVRVRNVFANEPGLMSGATSLWGRANSELLPDWSGSPPRVAGHAVVDNAAGSGQDLFQALRQVMTGRGLQCDDILAPRENREMDLPLSVARHVLSRCSEGELTQIQQRGKAIEPKCLEIMEVRWRNQIS